MAIQAGETTSHQANRGIIQDGLVLNLDAGVKDSYNSGTTWRDLKGSNDGTLINDSAFEKERGGSIVLDGTDDYIEIPDFEDINLTNVSFSVCLKLDNLNNDYDIISKGRHSQDVPILCWYDVGVGSPANVGGGNSGAISCLTYDGDTQIWVASASNIVTADEIFILDITIDASVGTLSLYKNGTLSNSYTNSNYDGIRNVSNTFRLGVDSNTTKDLPGAFYFFRAYNKCLTASEVSRNFTAMRHRLGI